MRVSEPLLLTLALAAVLVVGVLYTGMAAGAPFEADVLSSCQPVAAVELHYTPPAVFPGTVVLLAAESVSASLPLTYTWEFGDATEPISGTSTSAEFTVTHVYSATGVYTVALTAWNTCTLTPATATTHVTVTSLPCVAPAGLGLTYTPTLAYTNTDVLFDGEVLTGSLPVTYSWVFGDGTPLVTGTATAPILSTTHTFTAAGVYSVSLAAWNTCAITPTWQGLTLTVSPCRSLSGVQVAFSPMVARVGQVITFTAGVSNGTPAWAFDWAFGDGREAYGAVVTHVYTAPLTYTVTLTAANPCSRQVATATLRLEPPLRYVFVPLVGRQDLQLPDAHLGYGANIAAADHVISLTVMGFDWAKGFVTWRDAGKGPSYNWVAVDNQLREFVPQVPNVLLRLNGPTPGGVGNPPVSASDLAAFSSFAQALAAHISSVWRPQGLETAAYEIWNEPNLDYEWGGHPNAGQYTALLKAAYGGIKAGDPAAVVVSAGLATTGGSAQDLNLAQWFYHAVEVVPDLTFLRNMYNNGARGYLDALGSHPYGGPDSPATPPAEASGPIYFRRAEEQHDVMLAYGDDSPVWATEVGWVLDTDYDLGEHNWMKVSEAQQAEYLAAAYAYADENWPWMGPMFLFNLDFATVDWYDDGDPMRWYSITYRDDPDDPGHSPILVRQAFARLRDMPKHSAW